MIIEFATSKGWAMSELFGTKRPQPLGACKTYHCKHLKSNTMTNKPKKKNETPSPSS